MLDIFVRKEAQVAEGELLPLEAGIMQLLLKTEKTLCELKLHRCLGRINQ
jgi:hypothetical protein